MSITVRTHPDREVREIADLIGRAFSTANELCHSEEAAEVQRSLAAARRALDAYATGQLSDPGPFLAVARLEVEA